MPHISGTVTGFDNKSVPNKKNPGRPYTVHIMVVDGARYEVGFHKPNGIGVGDVVNFEYEVKFGNNQVQGGINKGTGGAPAATPAPAASAETRTGGGGGGRGNYGGVAKVFPVPVDHPDRSIIRQNALAHATKLYCDYNRTPDFGDQSLDECVEDIINIAYKFEEYATGQREVNALKSDEQDKA